MGERNMKQADLEGINLKLTLIIMLLVYIVAGISIRTEETHGREEHDTTMVDRGP
jgi:hypothetical protein